MEISLRV